MRLELDRISLDCFPRGARKFDGFRLEIETNSKFLGECELLQLLVTLGLGWTFSSSLKVAKLNPPKSPALAFPKHCEKQKIASQLNSPLENWNVIVLRIKFSSSLFFRVVRRVNHIEENPSRLQFRISQLAHKGIRASYTKCVFRNLAQWASQYKQRVLHNEN